MTLLPAAAMQISTGNGMLDMVMCLLVPLILRSLVPWINDFVLGLLQRTPTPKHTFSRTIEFTRNGSYWW